MEKGLFYWLGAISCVFPVLILHLPVFLILIIVTVIFLLSMFLPTISVITEAVLWVIAAVNILSHPFSFITVLFFVIGIYWLISNVPFIIAYWYDIIKNK